MGAFKELARLSFPGPEHRGLLLMLAAYFDDSGTHDASRVVTWGGFIATSEQWEAFDLAWRAALDRPLGFKPRLKKFSLAQCRAKREEFSAYSQAESDRLQNEMRQIIADHRLLGMAFAVDRQAWDRMVVGAARAYLGDAEVVCFSACFNGAIDRAIKHFKGEHLLSLHFDLGRRSRKLDDVIDTVRKNYRGPPILVNMSFDVVEVMTPLQAADIIATENYWHASGVLNGNTEPRPHLAHFLGIGSTEGYLLDEVQIAVTLKQHASAISALSRGEERPS